MAVPALKLEEEDPMEERIARIETAVEHIQADVSDLKIDMRRLNDKIDGVDQKLTTKGDTLDLRLTGKIDALGQKLTDKIDALGQKLTDKIDALGQKLTDKIDASTKEITTALGKLNVSRMADRVWQLSLLGGVLAIMARAFKWI